MGWKDSSFLKESIECNTFSLKRIEGRFVEHVQRKRAYGQIVVAESSGALPSYIRRSLESSQNFLSKNLSDAPALRGCITQLIVALLAYQDYEKYQAPTQHKRDYYKQHVFVHLDLCQHYSCTHCSITVKAKKNGRSTKKIARSATIALSTV